MAAQNLSGPNKQSKKLAGCLQIKLSTKSFGFSPDNSAEVAARAIEASAATLTDVDLSDVIAGAVA